MSPEGAWDIFREWVPSGWEGGARIRGYPGCQAACCLTGQPRASIGLFRAMRYLLSYILCVPPMDENQERAAPEDGIEDSLGRGMRAIGGPGEKPPSGARENGGVLPPVVGYCAPLFRGAV